MKTLEDLISKAKGAVDVIGEKAGQFASVSKLNLKVMDAKTQVKHELEVLGKMVYENFGDDIKDSAEVTLKFKPLKNSTLKLKALNLKLLS